MFNSFTLGKSGTLIFSGTQVCYSRDATQNEKKKSLRKNKRCVLYPNFEKLKEFTTDPFWINALEDCKSGSLNKELKFEVDCIGYKKGKKTFSFKLDAYTEVKFNELRAFLFSTVGIQSPRDESERNRNIKMQDAPKLTFSKIKSCSHRLKLALSHYITLLSKKREWNGCCLKGAESLIRNAINAGTISEKNVTIENNLFVDIDNVYFNPSSRKIEIDHSYKTLGKSNATSTLNYDTSSMSHLSETSGFYPSPQEGDRYLISEWKKYCSSNFGKAKSVDITFEV